MIHNLLRRLALLICTLLAASVAIFGLIHAAGDPVDGYLAPGTSDAVREQARTRLGLDRPLVEQFANFVLDGMTGQFGDSWRSRQPALDIVLDRLPETLILAGSALLVAAFCGLALGIVAAMTASRTVRLLTRLLAISGQAVPAFWLGTVGILIFAVRLRWLPASGDEGWRSLVLPALALAAYPGTVIARLIQTSMLEISRRPFVEVARSKGLLRRSLWFGHVLPNALVTSLAFLGVQATYLVGGTIVVESVFAYPGLGLLALQATSDRDIPVIHAVVVTVVLIVGVVNLGVDLIATLLDPEQRTSGIAGIVNG